MPGKITLSILECLRTGQPIDIAHGTFGDGGGYVVNDPINEYQALATSGTVYNFLTGSVSQNLNQSNVQTNTVPAGERWDLTSLGWYLMSPTGASLTEASTAAAAYTFFQSASYTIKINQTVVRQGPMFPFMGHLQGNTTAVSTVLAMTTERPAESWTDQFGDETPIILAEKVKVYLTVNCSAVAAALNGFLLGYRMGRLRANLSL
jgi:hypothetical protein